MSYTGKYALAKHETLALKCEELERQLAEVRELLLQVQDHMHQLSSHTSDGWAGASADNVFNMIEDKLEEKANEYL